MNLASTARHDTGHKTAARDKITKDFSYQVESFRFSRFNKFQRVIPNSQTHLDKWIRIASRRAGVILLDFHLVDPSDGVFVATRSGRHFLE